ncbi:MAG: hypothetical protein ACO3ZZ_05200, partial [Solirubrobacterales bacterium]
SRKMKGLWGVAGDRTRAPKRLVHRKVNPGLRGRGCRQAGAAGDRGPKIGALGIPKWLRPG